MTLTEALSEGLMTTFVGLLIVFSVLIILMLVMMLMKVIFYKPETKTAEKPAPSAPAVVQPESNAADEAELIAVLTAAVAVCMDKPASKLNIKSYRRIKNTAPAWNKAGVRDVIDARF